MIKFETSRFGSLEVSEGKVINFPSGILGFPEIKRFTLIEHKDSPLKWLHAIDDPDIAFIVASPDAIVDSYNIDLDRATRSCLKIDNDDDLAVLVIMRVEGEDVMVNFQGPILINAASMTGIQIALEETDKSYHKLA